MVFRPPWRPPGLRATLPALLLCLAPPAVDSRLGLGAAALTEATFDGFMQRNARVLVDFYDRDDPKWDQLQTELTTAVRQIRDFGSTVPIAKVDAMAEPSLSKKFVPDGRYPQLLWFVHGHPTQYHRTLRTAKNIADFVVALDRDPVVTAEREADVANYNRALFAQIRKESPMYKVLVVVASKHLDTFAFVFMESDRHNVTWVSDDGKSAAYTGEADIEAVEHFVRQQSVKSEDIPVGTESDSASVVVVGKTFEELVLRKDKDVYLLIYAPWCGFSRKFFPVWESFARQVAHVPQLVTAIMDGDRNSSPVPEIFQWSSYPTIFFLRAGTQTPLIFHGNRTVTNLLEFANEHGSATITLNGGVEEPYQEGEL